MPIEILMPALSPTMTEGKLAKWVKNEGDKVTAGDVIAEIETDKATMEVEAVDEGTIGKIMIAAGTENVAVNTPIAVLLEEGESKDAIGISSKPVIAAEAATQSDTVTSGQVHSGLRQNDETVNQPEGADIDNRDILYAQGHVIAPPKFDEAKFWNKTEKNDRARGTA